MDEGDALRIVTSDFEPIGTDLKAWGRMTGNGVTVEEKDGATVTYEVSKGHETRRRHRVALVVSEDGLEQLLSPLGFALAAALSGSDVHIYFQGPAVRVLKCGFQERLQGLSRPFSRFARHGLANAGHVAAQEKVVQLHQLGAHVYVCGPSMEHFGVKKADLIFDDAIIAEYFTFIEVMEKADIHIFVQ